MATGIPARLTAAEGRKFAFTVGIAFVVIATILWWRGHPLGMRIAGGIGTALLAAGLLVPASLGPVYRAWMGGAHALSKITTPIFMGIIYFGLITAVGWVMRRFGRDPLIGRPNPATAWHDRDPSSRRSTLDHQF